MPEVNRRQFVILATAAVAGCAVCQSVEAAAGVKQLTEGSVDIGPKSDYTKDGVFDKYAKEQVFVIRNEGKLYATTTVCTHKNANLKLKEGNIVCPNHGSKFSTFGTPIKGPAKISLFRYGISEKDGKLTIDRSKTFAEKNWDEEGAFIKL